MCCLSLLFGSGVTIGSFALIKYFSVREDKALGSEMEANLLKLSSANVIIDPIVEDSKFDESFWTTVHEGIWGNWKHTMESPRKGWLACGIALQHEKETWWNFDETAANGVQVKYCNPADWHEQVQ